MATAAPPFSNILTATPPRRRISRNFKYTALVAVGLASVPIIQTLRKTAQIVENEFHSDERKVFNSPSNDLAGLIVVETGSPRRIKHGLEIWQHSIESGKNPKQILLISGVDISEKDMNPAEVLKQLCEHDGMNGSLINKILEEIKMHPNQVFLGFGARDTIGNAIETKALLKEYPVHEVEVISSGIHLVRSKFLMKKELDGALDLTFVAAPECHPPSKWQRWHEIGETYLLRHGGLRYNFRKHSNDLNGRASWVAVGSLPQKNAPAQKAQQQQQLPSLLPEGLSW